MASKLLKYFNKFSIKFKQTNQIFSTGKTSQSINGAFMIEIISNSFYESNSFFNKKRKFLSKKDIHER